MALRILTVSIGSELDVVAARRRAREIALLCGFTQHELVRIATSVSELARNVYNYAREGKVVFSIEEAGKGQALQIAISDTGPGIANLDEILAGRYQSQTGMGLGIIGAQRLMDRFDIRSAAQGTEIVMQKMLARNMRFTARAVGEMCAKLATATPDSMLVEVQQQNQELLSTLAELKERQEQMIMLTGELEETNRGMVALYAELDDKAEQMRHANQMKTRFLSNMSHEFRTPLSSIRALAKLLLSRIDGDLSIEQEKQVGFILKGTIALSDMVDDLLDLAKIEAGKVDVRPEKFDLGELFGSLRAMLRPLLSNPALALNFIEPAPGTTLFTDQGKLSQILRNFVSNAIKFTEQGQVSVTATVQQQGLVSIAVSDTGLGIDPANLELIFEEFNQIENHLQARSKGTGLGLPLCRKLAALLNGSVSASSTPGAGSVFTVTIPLEYTESAAPGWIPSIPVRGTA
ncbi:MAG: ATP-binding protein [Pseudomonadota bacterium]